MANENGILSDGSHLAGTDDLADKWSSGTTPGGAMGFQVVDSNPTVAVDIAGIAQGLDKK